MSSKSLLEIRQLVEKNLLINPNSRQRCLSFLAEIIGYAHACTPNQWIVRCHPQRDTYGIHLRVGNVTPFAIEREKFCMALDEEQLSATNKYSKDLEETNCWEWQTGERSRFKRVKSRNGRYFPDKDPQQEFWHLLRGLNLAVIKRIGELKYQLYQNSRGAYQPAVIKYLCQELKQPIPEPVQLPGLEYNSVELPQEISQPEVFHEGVCKQIAVNAYERNQDARDKCLEHYGYKCAVCEQYMAKIYGEVAAKLIHVHHLKPLSKVKEGYEVDPIKDLRPVCPNCHAVIHFRGPPHTPYTIEEVKDFLEKARQNG